MDHDYRTRKVNLDAASPGHNFSRILWSKFPRQFTRGKLLGDLQPTDWNAAVLAKAVTDITSLWHNCPFQVPSFSGSTSAALESGEVGRLRHQSWGSSVSGPQVTLHMLNVEAPLARLQFKLAMWAPPVASVDQLNIQHISSSLTLTLTLIIKQQS